MFKLLSISILIVLVQTLAFGAGKTEDKDFQKADGLQNWSKEISLKDKKPGMYNVLIRGKDAAGNITIQGPINILVDPDSDLPIVSINNPLVGLRVGGDLNIVGTAVDDDGIAKVEVAIDKEEFKTATGTAFWNLLFDGKTVADGPHTIRVRATDINGLTGKEVTSSFNLDKYKPRNEINNYTQGVLVAGRIELKGTVEDENGIGNFYYSLDEGKNFIQNNLSLDDKTKKYNFNFNIDTNSLKDGPHIIWLKSTDLTKSIGTSAFLIFVDNTAPSLDFISPTPSDKVQGRTLIIGKSQDALGIKSLSYTLNQKEIQITPTPGDLYFSTYIDLPITGNQFEIPFTAIDNSGNKTAKTLKVIIDPNLDLPTVKLNYPDEAAKIDPKAPQGMAFFGYAQDDDGIKSLAWFIDSNKETITDIGKNFYLSLPDLGPGEHVLNYQALDIFGTRGKIEKRKFIILPTKPLIEITNIEADGKKDLFKTGYTFLRDKKNQISGKIITNGAISKSTISFGNLKQQSLTISKSTGDNTYSFSQPIPSDIEYGIVPIKIDLEDSNKNIISDNFYIYVKNYTKSNEPVGFVFPKKDFKEVNLSIDSSNFSIIGFTGEIISKVELSKNIPNITIEFTENTIQLKPQSAILSEKVQLKVTTSLNHIFKSDEFQIKYDNKAPIIELKSPQFGFFNKDSYTIEGSVKDETILENFEYSIDEGANWNSLLSSTATKNSTNFKTPISGMKEGYSRILLRASDSNKNTAIISIFGLFDKTIPEFSKIEYTKNAISTQVPLSYEILENNLKTVQLSYDNKNFQSISRSNKSLEILDLTRFQGQKAWIKAIDLSGNEKTEEIVIETKISDIQKSNSLFNPDSLRTFNEESANVIINGTDSLGSFTYGSASFDIPAPDGQVRVGFLGANPKKSFKKELSFGYWAQGTLIKAGDSKLDLVSIEYNFDNGNWQTLSLADFGTAKLDTSSLPVGAHSLSLRASDSKTTSEPVSFNFEIAALEVPGEPIFGIFAQGTIKAKLNLATDATWSIILNGKKIKDISNGNLELPLDQNPGVYALRGQFKNGSQTIIPLAINPLKDLQLKISFPTEAKEYENSALIRLSLDSVIPLKNLKIGESDLALSFDQKDWAFNTPLTSKDGQILIQAENILGQKFKSSIKIPINKKLDEPVLSFPFTNFSKPLSAQDTILGQIQDDDGLLQITYTLDGGEARIIENTNNFIIGLPENSGRHTLDIAIKDAQGGIFNQKQFVFTVKDILPELSFEFSDQNGVLPSSPGILVGNDKLSFQATWKSTATITKAEYSIDGATPISISFKTEKDKTSVVQALAKELSFGRHELVLKIIDSYSRENIYSYIFEKIDESYKGQLNDDAQILIKDGKVIDGNLALKIGDEITVFANTRPIESVNFEPKNQALEASFDGKYIKLKAIAEINLESVNVLVKTIDGDLLKLEKPLGLAIDGQAPEILIDPKNAGVWTKNVLQFPIDIKDNGQVKSLTYTLDALKEENNINLFKGQRKATVKQETKPVVKTETSSSPTASGQPKTQTPTPIETPVQVQNGVYYADLNIDLKDLAEGGHYLFITALDDSGNTQTIKLDFYYDKSNPEIFFYTPLESDKVNGIFTIGAQLRDSGEIVALSYSSDGKKYEPITLDGILSQFSQLIDLSKLTVVPEAFLYKVEDKAGNITEAKAPIQFDPEADKPVILIQLPLEDEVMRQDFMVSGMAFDDDKIGKILYRIDSKSAKDPFTEIEGSSNFSIPLKIADLGDNEHTIEFYAIDMYGKEGDHVIRKFRVSLEEPKGSLLSPDISITNRGSVVLKGKASDKNGIKEIWLSLNNGLNFVKVSDGPEFTYTFDSNLFEDGVMAVQIKSIDNYDTDGLYATICNIDNKAPKVTIDAPANGQELARAIRVDGRVSDNIVVEKLEYVISLLDENQKIKQEVARGNLPTLGTFSELIDLSKLPSTWYNIRLEAQDKAKNQGFASKNFKLVDALAADSLLIQYPQQGSTIQGLFSIEGQIIANERPESIAIFNGQTSIGEAKVDKSGYFSLYIGPGTLGTGKLNLIAKAKGLSSIPISVDYKEEGPWINIENVHYGTYLRNRPYIEGKAGWFLWPLTEEQKKDEQFIANRKLIEDASGINKIEYSFDNGRSFQIAEGTSAWKFRFESLLIPDGPIYLTLKVSFKDDSFMVTQTRLFLDQTGPQIEITYPKEGGKFNEGFTIKGIASDSVELTTIDLVLRSGDKAGYELPSFIQGMYIDGHALGATLWEAGLGLSFFDNNVRLQAHLGSAPEGRFEGQVIGAKLLASVFKLPWSSIFGPDLENFSTTLAVGAKFNFFTQSPDFDFSKGLGLAAVIGHLDLVRWKFGEGFLNSITLYAEYEAWMISADVAGGVFSKVSFGTMVGLF